MLRGEIEVRAASNGYPLWGIPVDSEEWKQLSVGKGCVLLNDKGEPVEHFIVARAVKGTRKVQSKVQAVKIAED